MYVSVAMEVEHEFNRSNVSFKKETVRQSRKARENRSEQIVGWSGKSNPQLVTFIHGK